MLVTSTLVHFLRGVLNPPARNATELVTAVKSLIVQAPIFRVVEDVENQKYFYIPD
jgi:hypothetical protein